MNLRASVRIFFLAIVLANGHSLAQEKPQPQVTVDLKTMGVAPDLFSDQSDSKTQQRGVISLFWLGEDRIAVAFSSNHRWSGESKPEPLNVHLLVFDPAGKQLNRRDWSFGADGPDGETTLEFAPGPDNSILAVHESASDPAAKIPEGNIIQVLNADTSLQQNFYVPATSAWVPRVLADSRLILQTFYADKHASLAWWSGHPLKAGPKIDLPRGTEEVIAGPGVAARATCANPKLCSGIRLYEADGKTALIYPSPSPEIAPMPQVFLSSTALLVELRQEDQKVGQLTVARTDGTVTPLPAMAKGVKVFRVSSVSSNGTRLAVDAAGEAGICGMFDIWCNQRGVALVVDITANKVVFQQEITATGGVSALAPDGKHVAIFDRGKMMVYSLP